MIRIFVSLFASILTGFQAYWVYSRGSGFCLDQGCEIVEKLTLVSPLYINLAGFFFFQVLLWTFLFSKQTDSRFLPRFADFVLLCGLAVESILVFYQYNIANAFCAYCLVICGLVVLLNILGGITQIVKGVVLAGAVLAACFSLQFGSNSFEGLEAGSIAHIPGAEGRPAVVLFFSEACPHCEAVIEEFRSKKECDIRLNPIDKMAGFTFPEAEIFEDYDISQNLGFLTLLSLKEIPVLLVRDEQETRLIRGEKQIVGYLNDACSERSSSEYGSGMSSLTPTAPAAYQIPKEEDCPVGQDCTEKKEGDKTVENSQQ
ncbi:MAG: hypothetical protein CSA20_09025 [Deltaproteobacteria bacterium]|nr:MAG: hypothetical protein CSA20_09025 [Deltaproteobacteria bacterium]